MSCSVNGQIFTVYFGNRTISANQAITIALLNFGINPKSTRPTSSFQLYLYSPDGYLVNYLNSSLIINNFIPIDFSFISITPTNYINNAIISYTFYIQQQAVWDNNSYLIINLPSEISPSSSNLTCQSGAINLTCTVINSTNIKIILSSATTLLSFRISSLINPPSYRTSSYFKFTTYTYDGYIYAVNSLINLTTTSPSLFNNLTYLYSNPYYNQTSNLSLNIVNTAAITSSYVISNFNQFNAGGNISCSSLTSTPLCLLNGSNLIITSSTTFPITNDITILNLAIPMANITQLTIKSYDNTYLMSTFSPINFQTICNLPCYTCASSSLPLVCTSCYLNTLFTTKIYYFQSNCYNSCPAGSYSENNSLICSVCSTTCAECLSISTNCIECNTSSIFPVLYLINNTCLSSCPLGTYASNSTNLTKYTPVCLACVYPCATCQSPTSCTSCSNSSLFYYKNQCLSSCPLNITIQNTTSMQC